MSSHPLHKALSSHAPSHAIPLEEVSAQPCEIERDLEQFLRHFRSAELDSSEGDGSLRQWLDVAEAWKITRTLRECRGNRSAAARKLGIGRRTLYAKMEKLKITPTWL